jgi:hypothetical protein
MATIKELRGAWSPATRVTFPDDTVIYADERENPKQYLSSQERERVPLQLHRWLGAVRPLGVYNEERVGDWWVERVLVGRGEYVGRLPYQPQTHNRPAQDGIPLVVWSATVPDQSGRIGTDRILNVRTDALITRTVLVDFEGTGANQSVRLGNRSGTEDPTLEVLLVDQNGAMTAHVLGRDKEDKERKERFGRWDAWFKAVKQATSKEKDGDKKDDKKKDGSGLFDK